MATTAYGSDTGYQAGVGKQGGGTVTAIIHNAVDLPDKDWFGKQDPYCIFDVGEQRFETPAVKSGGENPYWDEQFSFAPSGVSNIKVTVYNKNRLRPDNEIGSGYVNLTSVNEGGITNVPIQDKKGNAAGTLRMSFRGLGGSSAGTGTGTGTGTGQGVYEQREQGYGSEQRTGSEMGTGVGAMGTGVGSMGTGVGALGTEERHRHREGQYEGMDVGQTQTGQYSSTGVTGTEAVCNQEYFTKTEDRPRVVERTEYVREHHPVEKQFVTETKYVGEQETGVRTVESLGVREEVVGEPVVTRGGTTTTTTGSNVYE